MTDYQENHMDALPEQGAMPFCLPPLRKCPYPELSLDYVVDRVGEKYPGEISSLDGLTIGNYDVSLALDIFGDPTGDICLRPHGVSRNEYDIVLPSSAAPGVLIHHIETYLHPSKHK
jgi:hypothetical protein